MALTQDVSHLLPRGRALYVPPLRWLWRYLLRMHFTLFQRYRYNRLVMEEVAGYPIVVLPQVFNPKLFRSGAFLLQNLREDYIPRGSSVLDMGTGSGIGAIGAARWARHVTAVDVNPFAVRCAAINIFLNRVEDRVKVMGGNLFEGLQAETFHVILFNPPFFRGEPEKDWDYAWQSTDVVERFAAGLSAHLKPGGYGLVALSTDGDLEDFLQAFLAQGLSIEKLAEEDLVNEILALYRIAPRPQGHS